MDSRGHYTRVGLSYTPKVRELHARNSGVTGDLTRHDPFWDEVMEKPAPRKYNCWKCGLVLEELTLPISRYEACPSCRAELHSCRMCRHFDAKVIGQCRHDRADRVEKKHESNYCTFFRLRHDAHRDQPRTPADDSNDALNALFGLSDEHKPVSETLDSLFDLPPSDDQSGEDKDSH
ncbi:MAG: hypothetical protein CMO26_08755 [Thiotrichales bacterium]|nr:hypothetical protein [Thiotrichales bacterium]